MLDVGEAGMGFGFLALIIGYVPVIYQAFSRREVGIAQMDARAGSPASAAEALRSSYRDEQVEELIRSLHVWERWCAEILESHRSYPILTYYRSQHERQSWLGTLTAILDVSALLLVGFEGVTTPAIRFTFAIARHTAVDLAYFYGIPPKKSKRARLPSPHFSPLHAPLTHVLLNLHHEKLPKHPLS